MTRHHTKHCTSTNQTCASCLSLGSESGYTRQTNRNLMDEGKSATGLVSMKSAAGIGFISKGNALLLLSAVCASRMTSLCPSQSSGRLRGRVVMSFLHRLDWILPALRNQLIHLL